MSHRLTQWPKILLRDVCQPGKPIVYGIVQPGPHIEDGVPFINSADIGKPFELNKLARTSVLIADQYKRAVLASGDVVVSLRGEIGNSSIVPPQLAGARLARGVARIAVQPQFMAEFVCYCLQAPHVLKKVLKASQGSALQEIPLGQLRKVEIPAVDIDEQRRIVAVLSTWDRAIEQVERLLALKERRKRALMQQLLTGKRRFPEFVRSKEVRDTRFGSRPSDWSYLQIGDFAHEAGERNGEGNDLPVLSCTKHTGLVSSLEYFGKRIFSEDTSPYKVVRRNEFAYATNHIEEGSIGLLDFLDAGLVSPMYTVFRTTDAVDNRFLYALFKTELYRHIFEVHTSASVDRRGSLRWNEFKKIHVALPSLDEQRRVAAVLNTCDDEIRHLRAKVDALKQQKKGLMQKLLTGEVQVPTGAGEES